MSDDLTCAEVRDLAPAFVLGALEPDEMDAVRTHLAECPKAHAEFVEFGSVVPALAETLKPVEPDPRVRDRILAAAAADRAGAGSPDAMPATAEVAAGDAVVAGVGPHDAVGSVAAAAAAPPVTAPVPAPATPVTPTPFPSFAEQARRAERARASRLGWALRAAAVLAIVVLGGWNLLLQGRLDASETYNRDVAAVLEVGAQPGAMTAVLAPQGAGGPRGLAALAPDGSLALAVSDLGPTSGSQVYEAWAIVGDAPPVPLGGFTVGQAGTGRLEGSGVEPQAGLAVALTLEPGPGATAPTGSPVVVGTMAAPPEAQVGARHSMHLAQVAVASGASLQAREAMVRG